MDCARRHHAAPMGLKTVLVGLVYYKHVAPMELAVAAFNYLFRRKEFGLSPYWPTNAELLAIALIISPDQAHGSRLPSKNSEAAGGDQGGSKVRPVEGRFGEKLKG